MTHLPTRKGLTILLAAAVALSAAGCEKKKKKAPPPPPPPPPVIETPKPVDIQAMLQEMKADQRVKFAEEQAPADRGMAESVVKLADAMAKGDAAAMKGMLSGAAHVILDELVSTGEWAAETKNIEQVRVVSLTNTSEADPTTTLVGMAIQAPGEAYLLAWNGSKQGEKWVFTNALSQSDTKPRASDFDNVTIQTTALPREDSPLTRPTASGPGAAEPEATPAGEPPTNPRRKSTPAGPIDVPGTPRSPGGG